MKKRAPLEGHLFGACMNEILAALGEEMSQLRFGYVLRLHMRYDNVGFGLSEILQPLFKTRGTRIENKIVETRQ